MKQHLKNLVNHVPELLKGKILDIGSGRGDFVLDVAHEGGKVWGIEKNIKNVEHAFSLAKERGLHIEIIEGVAEKLPYKDFEFDFINIAEVIEHVEEPNSLLTEAYRVLKNGGYIYLSVPSRFSLKDPHFHLYFVNWLPRFMSDSFISIFGKHKDYLGESGEQRLKEMHYYRFNDIKRNLIWTGFEVTDIREKKIKNKIQNKALIYILLLIYKTIRPFYFDSFHLLLKR